MGVLLLYELYILHSASCNRGFYWQSKPDIQVIYNDSHLRFWFKVVLLHLLEFSINDVFVFSDTRNWPRYNIFHAAKSQFS